MSSTSQPLLPQLDLQDGVTVWDADAIDEERRCRNADGHADRLVQTINVLGLQSREAQGLNVVLTSVARLRENRQARVYLYCSEGCGVGILKVGVKKLFVVHHAYPALVEIDPLCVLDFFVQTRHQRHGIGRMLFDAMLVAEELQPGEVAIDRPSVKFLSFLRKHYGLAEYTPQSNNFVVFHKYFDTWRPQRGGSRGNPGMATCSSTSLSTSAQAHGALRMYPGYQGTLVDGNNNNNNNNSSSSSNNNNNNNNISNQRKRLEAISHLFSSQPTSSTFSHAAQERSREKTTYEIQYEEYLREQQSRHKEYPQSPQHVPSLKTVSSAEIAASNCHARQRVSPTRSGVQYNIISGGQGP